MTTFDGRKDLGRRIRVAAGSAEDFDVVVPAWRKTALTYALRLDVPFRVETIEGVMEGKAGDYLAVGTSGELYPIDAQVFAESYAAAIWEAGVPVEPK